MWSVTKLCVFTVMVLKFSCNIVTSIEDINIYYKEIWMARPVVETRRFKYTGSISNVVIHETGGSTCDNFQQCSKIARDLQDTDIEVTDDIRYNFLIGGDGAVYEGRGWYKVGAAVYTFDNICISIAFFGNFSGKVLNNPDGFVTPQAWDTFQKFLNYGEELRYLKNNYRILGYRQFYDSIGTDFDDAIDNPGINLFILLVDLPHYSSTSMAIDLGND